MSKEKVPYDNKSQKEFHILYEFLEHVFYEVDMLQQTTQKHNLNFLNMLEGNSVELYFNNALLEVFCTHCRNLICFFIDKPIKNGKKKSEDDALALDYFNDDTWLKVIDSISEENFNVLSDFRKRTAKEVLHLTYKRKNNNDPNKNWNQGTINIIYDLFSVFLGSLPEDFHTQDVTAFFKLIQDRVWKEREIIDKIHDKLDNIK